MMRWLVFLSVLLSPHLTEAANKFVKPTAAGTGSGADWSNACTFVGNCAPASLTRGDVVYVADGSYSGVNFNTSASGTGTTRISILKCTTTDGVSSGIAGYASTDCDGGATFTSGLTFSTSYWLLDGINGGGPGSWASGHGFVILVTPANVCGDNGNLVSLPGTLTDINIKHVDMSAVDNDYPINGIKGTTGAISNSTFAYNYIHQIFGPAYHMNAWTDSTMEYSYVYDLRSTGTTDAEGFCNNWHAEGVSSIGTNDNLTWRHSVWDAIQGTAVFAGVNAGTSSNWKIYGNVIINSTAPPLYYYDDASNTNVMTNLLFYNNTLVHNQSGSQGGIAIDNGSGNVCQNNLFYDNIANAFNMACTHDYNYASLNRRTEGCSPTPCDKDTEILTGEANGQNGSDANPFVSANGSILTGNYALTSATTAGNTLASPYDIDLTGVTRGSDGTWDRGAYEYASAAVVPSVGISGSVTFSGSVSIH